MGEKKKATPSASQPFHSPGTGSGRYGRKTPGTGLGATEEPPGRLPYVKYTEVARFSSRVEAETVGHALDPYDIPFLVQSADTGMFGPGMVGWSPGGAALLVPDEHLDRVRELLDCVVRPVAEDDDEEPAASDD